MSLAERGKTERTMEDVRELKSAAELTVQHFERNRASGNFQGDDEHECWNALLAALEKVKRWLP